MSKRQHRGNSRGYSSNRGNNQRDVYSRGNPRDAYNNNIGKKPAGGGNEPEVSLLSLESANSLTENLDSYN